MTPVRPKAPVLARPLPQPALSTRPARQSGSVSPTERLASIRLFGLEPDIVASGTCLIAVIAGRTIAWFTNATSLEILAGLLGLALTALAFGRRADAVTADFPGTSRVQRFLARLCHRAAWIQTAVAVATLVLALV